MSDYEKEMIKKGYYFLSGYYNMEEAHEVARQMEEGDYKVIIHTELRGAPYYMVFGKKKIFCEIG